MSILISVATRNFKSDNFLIWKFHCSKTLKPLFFFFCLWECVNFPLIWLMTKPIHVLIRKCTENEYSGRTSGSAMLFWFICCLIEQRRKMWGRFSWISFYKWWGIPDVSLPEPETWLQMVAVICSVLLTHYRAIHLDQVHTSMIIQMTPWTGLPLWCGIRTILCQPGKFIWGYLSERMHMLPWSATHCECFAVTSFISVMNNKFLMGLQFPGL